MMLALQARYDEALLTLERAGEVYRLKEDLEGELRALAQVGRIHRWRGTSWQGLTRLLPLLQRLPQIGASRGAAAFYVALAYLYKGAGQYSEQLAAAEQAATLARASGDDYILTTAQERRAAALLALGRLEETCRALTKEVIPASEASGNLWTLITAHDNLAGAYEFLGDYQQARASLEQAIALDERLGDPAEMVYLLYGLGLLCLAEGRQEEAAHYLKEALTLAERNHDMQALCWVQGSLAEWDLLAGRPEAARGRLAPLRWRAWSDGEL